MSCSISLLLFISLFLIHVNAIVEIEYSGDVRNCDADKCHDLAFNHFLCTSSPYWTSDRTYKDPTPPGSYTITTIAVTLTGSFCSYGDRKRSSVELTLNEMNINTMDITVGNTSDTSCVCRNCGSAITATIVRPNPPYFFGGNNTFSISLRGEFDMCLSSVIIAVATEDAPLTTSSTTTGIITTSTSTTGGNATTTGGLDPETHKLVVMGGVMLGGMLCINLLVVGGWYCWKRKGYDLLPENEGGISPHQLGKAITFKDVVLAERIGRGSFGEVYRGIWLSTEVAVKKLPMDIIANPTLIEEFNREVKLLRSLMHPNILQFMGSSHIPPDICLITEYMPRGDLYKIIHDPAIRLDWELIKRFAIDIGRGMNYLHRSNPVIIHRDLKSHNVLIGQHWNAKVADFGLSKIIKDSVEYGKFTPCGTPKWAAPEVLRNEHYSTQADVYSFGIILWEMATRHDPFPNMSAFELIVQVGRNNLRPTLPVNLYPPLERLITSCWNDNANKRPTFEQLLQTFESL